MAKFLDRTGVRYGNLTATRLVQLAAKRKKWECICDCGRTVIVEGANLSTGNTKSCGCLWDRTVKKEMEGKRFGRLLVISEAGAKVYANSTFMTYLCKCDCGNEIVTLGMSLRNKNTTSCGCAQAESARSTGIAAFKDLSGKKVNRLTVIRRAKTPVGSGNAKFLCICECGSEVIVTGNALSSGRQISCGCVKNEPKVSEEAKIATSRKCNATRRSAKINATKIFDHEFFSLLESEIYLLAVDRSIKTGVPHEVDHIVPLQSKVVCGLHNEFNLRVITRRENLSKKNYFWPDMPIGREICFN